MSRITLSAGEVQALYDKLEEIEKLVKHQTPQIEDPMFSTEQVMKLLNISRRKLQQIRDDSQIEFSALGGKLVYRLSGITKMLDKNLIKAGD